MYAATFYYYIYKLRIQHTFIDVHLKRSTDTNRLYNGQIFEIRANFNRFRTVF